MPKRRKLRWDRIGIAAFLLIALIFLFGACVHSCSDEEIPASPRDESTAEQTGAAASGTETADGTAITSGTTVSTPATTVNIPMIRTDEVVTGGPVVSTTTEATTASDAGGEPVFVLPEGYQEVSIPPESVYRGCLLLVNSDYPCRMSRDELDLVQVYYSDDRPTSYEISYPGHTSLNKTAVNKFNRLMRAYYDATGNTEVMFNYGYLEVGKEKSNSESSCALDIQLHIKRNDGGYEYITNIAPYSWLFEHMASYGFVQRFPADKAELTGDSKSGFTAIRYVGVPHAAYMKENGLCLEEYLELLKTNYNFRNGNRLTYSTTELTYSIYYVPATLTGDTVLPVPRTGSYEVSGNNMDGFIVTAIVG